MISVEPRTIKVDEFAKILDLEILCEGKGEIALSNVNVSRPGLQLAGFFDYFGENRISILGNAEMTYFEKKPENDKNMIIDMILERGIPCLIISRSLNIPGEIFNSCERFKTPLFRSKLETTQLINDVIIFLNNYLAASTTIHSVFVDVSGVGVLLTGKSGLGKSETALELIKRGHRLVSDDAVLIKNIQNKLYGEAPHNIKNLMEIRGVGIIDIRSMYGVTAIKDKKKVDLVVEMQPWDSTKEYDRIGGDSESETILDVTIPKLVIPISPGRNMPAIIEAAAANFLAKRSGYDPSKILINKLFEN